MLDGDGNTAGFGDTLHLDSGVNRPFDDITCIALVGDTNGAQAKNLDNITLINTEPVVDTPANIGGTSTSTETLPVQLRSATSTMVFYPHICLDTHEWSNSNGMGILTPSTHQKPTLWMK